MIGSLQNAWKLSNLRSKILFTLLMFLVFRIGAHIPVPFFNRDVLKDMLGAGGIFDFFNTISGGSFKNLTVFAMSVTPYITSSIILSLLQMVIPSLEKIAKDGDFGRKRIAQYTRYGTIVLGFITAIGMTLGLRGALAIPEGVPTVLVYLVVAIVLTAGTAFLMWLGELITEKGIGNGISLIIFCGIVSRLPDAIKNLFGLLRVGEISIFAILGLVLIALLVIAGVVFVQEGQRRIQVQYAKRVVGRRVYGGQSSHLPLKVNQAGVIPVIFAISLLGLPQQIASWTPNTSGFHLFVTKWLSMNGSLTSIPYLIAYALLIIFFSYFYTQATFNPVDVADNLKKHGGFIPGLRPGRPTSEYIAKVSNRIILAGGLFLAVIAILPTLMMPLTGIANVSFGGTSLLIVVGVALDTMKQLESHLMMRHYQGFIK